MHKYKIISLMVFLLQILSAQDKPLTHLYKNEKPIQKAFYADDENLYISAATYFNDNKNKLSLGTQESTNTFEQIKNKFLQIITQHPNSLLKDDAQLAISEAAKYLNDKNLYETELQKVIDDFPNQHITYLNFEHPVCNSILPALQSSFVQSDAYAKLQLAMIYYSNTIISTEQNYNTAITKFEDVIQDFPYSYCAAVAQYYKAQSYESLSFSTAIDKNIVVDEYEKVFDLYKGYSQKYSELALVRIGDFAKNYLPGRMPHFKTKMETFYSLSDYIAESRFELSGNSRWNKTTVTLYFKRINAATTTQDSTVVNEVISKFNNYVNPHISITLTSNESIADIKIDFSTNQGNFTQLNTSGSSETVKRITSAKIFLKDNSNIEKRKEILLHEMGHAFGLGHSFNPADNLYFTGNNKFEYSSRDIATLEKLYSSVNTAPFFLTKPHTPRINPEEKIFFDVDAQDLDFEYPDFSILNKPSWLEIDSYSGKITGVPPLSAKGYHEYVIRISDGQNAKAEVLWKFMVDSNPTVTDIKEVTQKEQAADELHPNFPNPFNPSTNIRFSLSEKSNVRLEIFNITGKTIYNTDWKMYDAGVNSISVNLSDKASGIYPYKLIIKGKTVLSGKLIMVK